MITDADQQVVWQASYDPFGKATVTNETITNNIRFPGQYYDAESGLHYNYFRYYDPGTGRYMTSDPIGLAGGINTYAYVANNPLYWSDPYGLRYSPYEHGMDWDGNPVESDPATQLAIGLILFDVFNFPSGEGIVPGIAILTGKNIAKEGAENVCKKSKKIEEIGDKFTKTIEVRPGKDLGQSRAEYVRYKNKDGKVIRTYKDSYDRAGNFQHRKPLRGGPEGRPVE